MFFNTELKREIYDLSKQVESLRLLYHGALKQVHDLHAEKELLLQQLEALKNSDAEKELVVIKGRLEFCSSLLPMYVESFDRSYREMRTKLEQIQDLLAEFCPPEHPVQDDEDDYYEDED